MGHGFGEKEEVSRQVGTQVVEDKSIDGVMLGRVLAHANVLSVRISGL